MNPTPLPVTAAISQSHNTPRDASTAPTSKQPKKAKVVPPPTTQTGSPNISRTAQAVLTSNAPSQQSQVIPSPVTHLQSHTPAPMHKPAITSATYDPTETVLVPPSLPSSVRPPVPSPAYAPASANLFSHAASFPPVSTNAHISITSAKHDPSSPELVRNGRDSTSDTYSFNAAPPALARTAAYNSSVDQALALAAQKSTPHLASSPTGTRSLSSGPLPTTYYNSADQALASAAHNPSLPMGTVKSTPVGQQTTFSTQPYVSFAQSPISYTLPADHTGHFAAGAVTLPRQTTPDHNATRGTSTSIPSTISFQHNAPRTMPPTGSTLRSNHVFSTPQSAQRTAPIQVPTPLTSSPTIHVAQPQLASTSSWKAIFTIAFWSALALLVIGTLAAILHRNRV